MKERINVYLPVSADVLRAGAICTGIRMKKHKFWCLALVVCLVMTIYTGYKHK